jgi:uncharacterized protein
MRPTNPSPIAQEYMETGRSDSCPIIDLHGHVGRFNSCYLPSGTTKRMLESAKRAGVRLMVCSHSVALTLDVERGNALMQEVIDEHPDRFLGYWVINPNYPEIVASDLDNFHRTRGFVGLKFWSDYHLVPLTSPLYARALEFADDHALLVKAHTWGYSPYDSPDLLGEIAERYPRARFLMAHAGFGEWDTSARIARELPNVYIDLTSVPNSHDYSLMPGGSMMPRSGASEPTINGIIEYFVEACGSRKVVFGSDLPWYSQHYHAGAILFARISDEARHDILHRNAERLLGSHLRNQSSSQAD